MALIDLYLCLCLLFLTGVHIDTGVGSVEHVCDKRHRVKFVPYMSLQQKIKYFGGEKSGGKKRT